MKVVFRNILNKSNDLIVLHETFNISNNVLNAFHDNDILFFDDCLYSQFVFITENNKFLIDHNITCVISFSTGIFRKDEKPIYEAICSEYHDKIHNNDHAARAAYMSLAEIRQLLEYDNVYLACHGDMHLQLDNDNITKMQLHTLFLNDIKIATLKLKEYNLKTNIFVYPYAYDDFPFSEYIVKKFGYLYAFAGKNTQRIPIEDLMYNII